MEKKAGENPTSGENPKGNSEAAIPPSVRETIAIIKEHAADVRKRIDAEIGELNQALGEMRRESTPSLSYAENERTLPLKPGMVDKNEANVNKTLQAKGSAAARKLADLERDFTDLHNKEVAAYSNRQFELARELDAKIQTLLHKHNAIIVESGLAVKDPGISYMNGWKNLRLGSHELKSFDPRLDTRYPQPVMKDQP